MTPTPQNSTSPPVLLRVRNNTAHTAHIAYILFLPLDRPDLLWSPPLTAELPTSPSPHSPFRSVATDFRPKSLDLSQIRVEPATIEIGSYPIDHPDVRHIAYHRGKALALLEDRAWFSHKGSERRQVYAEHYYSRSNVELIERYVCVDRRGFPGNAAAVDRPERCEDDEWETDDEEQRTAAAVAAITANMLRETQSEPETKSEAETGSLTRDLRGRTGRGEQARPGFPSLTVPEPRTHRFSNKNARAALPTLGKIAPPLPITLSELKPQRPRRATTSQRIAPAPESPASPRKPGSFWKHLRRQREPLTTSLPPESLRRRFLTSAKESLTLRNDTRPLYPEGMWENPRSAPKPPPGPKPEFEFPHPELMRRESQETMNSFAFVVKAAQDPEFFRM
jgi:hypothetical protein